MAQDQRSPAGDEKLEAVREKIEEAKAEAAEATGYRPSNQASKTVPDEEPPARDGHFSPS
ncbi:hypothetical protein FHX82_006116 [Amycolatopsis bartoniae]|uniref:Uncharacterized protein n=1 Tax=Amycolatopsis bartoniae TaxID=941986 RepID=A0A8H9IVB8_9PSEU|nr:hypothetical protein [Amycolatopsis bartoniae]MBB2939030.1 hypothetical protein [Amycolatopsis bartoniae]TVT04281.1 hypothetical protein FNH07_24390 [Amycolatopsis bartoniae]GHF65485.1 hypothetical protein GCM10017566_43770 [Amycolatopsis bartoniae]